MTTPEDSEADSASEAASRRFSIPYLRSGIFLRDRSLRFDHETIPNLSELQESLLEEVFLGGALLEDLARKWFAGGMAESVSAAEEALRTGFADPDSIIGLADVDLAEEYDVVIVEQGYGGVYVHSVELLRKLRKRWRCLLLCPVEPLFESRRLADCVTLSRLRERNPDLGYFSYVHLVRSIVARVRCRLLLITHRSQSLFLFDLLRNRRTVIYCDGYYDGAFRRVHDFQLDETPERRRAVLSEIYYLISNGDPGFYGIQSVPAVNPRVLMAGGYSLAAAEENWCWGHEQRQHFASELPALQERIRFMPPFTDPGIFRPEWVERDSTVLFTTTMHNIARKGLPELVRALARLPDVRVRCVVRQPQHLPSIPPGVAARMTMGALEKDEMVRLYHRVWMNCRTSREESSPISILESMICEVPQVVSPVVARQLPILSDGHTGFVVDPDDRDGLVRAMRILLSDRRLRDRMGRECRRRASQYSFDKRVGEFDRFLA